ncbi:MAG: thiopeptide-type bacteriocin biosynthesis protein [Bacteroidota bacterium]
MKWLAAYLYYNEPWDQLLVEALRPFANEIMEAGLAEKYFFIRYWEQGPHIRLRFFGDEKTLETQVKPKLDAWFKAWFAANPSQYDLPEAYAHIPAEQNWYPNNSVQWIEYEPETERYGGIHALPVAEDQFRSSTDVVLTVMDESGEWSYDQALGTAIQLHLAFAKAMGMDRNEAAAFYQWVFRSWLPMALPGTVAEKLRPAALEEVIKAFNHQLSEQKDVLAPFVNEFWQALQDDEEFDEAWINDWISSQTAVKQQLTALADQQKIEYPMERSPKDNDGPWPWEKLRFWSIYTSYVHMTNNRLGVQNRDEGYLGFLLANFLKTT